MIFPRGKCRINSRMGGCTSPMESRRTGIIYVILDESRRLRRRSGRGKGRKEAREKGEKGRGARKVQGTPCPRRTQDLFSIPPPSRPLVSPNVIFCNGVNLEEEVQRK